MDILQRLENLRFELEQIKAIENVRANIFDAVGMERQEVKHSAFIAWLLDPDKPHGLGNRFLAEFCKRLFNDESAVVTERNRKALAAGGIRSADDLTDFINDKKIEVFRERVLVDSESRIDIYIESKATKTAVVIENKVFTDNHDDQLYRYIEQLNTYSDNNRNLIERKIFVYLTPLGTPPDDRQQHSAAHDMYCLFSYRTILSIIDKLARYCTEQRVLFLMEDYVAMVKKNILKEDEKVRAKCREIYRSYEKEIELLLRYNSDNASEVIKYCKERLIEKLQAVVAFKDSDKYFEFYTPAMEEAFKRRGELIREGDILKLRVCLSAQKPDITVGYGLQKNGREAEWSNVQHEIIDGLAQSKANSGKYVTLKNFVLLKADRREQSFDEVRDDVERQLALFIEAFQKFEKTISAV